MEIVNTLEIDDATQRTDILERISEVYGQLNRARAVLEGRRKELGTREGRAEFGAQFKLLTQAVSNISVSATRRKRPMSSSPS